MPTTPNDLFSTVADPTRRAIFERLARDGEQTVRVLTGHSGVSQPAVSKHLDILKRAGLVHDRREGRQRAASSGAADRLDEPLRRLLARPFRPPRRFVEQDGPMTKLATPTRSLVIERDMPHLLIEEWLMKNDFQPVVGHRFNFRADPMPQWNGVTDCEVLIVEPYERLSYSWNASGEEAANGLKTVVTWRLTPTKGGTLVRMEQSGFRPEDDRFYQGAGYGWQKMIAGLEQVVSGLD
jgi:uncharacterized protein YndB with AHSA1/START domain/DNA-binding transcriptional ArsR family regulator